VALAVVGRTHPEPDLPALVGVGTLVAHSSRPSGSGSCSPHAPQSGHAGPSSA
jgi:hypothetical protein